MERRVPKPSGWNPILPRYPVQERREEPREYVERVVRIPPAWASGQGPSVRMKGRRSMKGRMK